MTTVTITTPSGASITATLAPISDRMPADGHRVAISQDGRRAGTARWVGSQITDIDARLGAADGSETEDAYRALDSALSEADVTDDVAHGLTFSAWLSAAGRKDSASDYDLRAAWRAGEDPAEYCVA